MTRSPHALGGAALVLMLWMAGGVRADLISWTYSWSNSPNNIYADSSSGYISLTNEATKATTNNSSIVATNLQLHTSATNAHPDVFTNKSYTLGLTLTDTASGASGNLVFTGHLDGTASAGNANINNTFTGPGVQSLQLGDNQYTVTIGPYTPPGPPNQVNSGSIGAFARVVVVHLPEPGALVLSVLGLSLVGLVRWCPRR
jgi:hypothetical protein